MLLTAIGDGAPTAGDKAVLVAGVVPRDAGAELAETCEGDGCDTGTDDLGDVTSEFEATPETGGGNAGGGDIGMGVE